MRALDLFCGGGGVSVGLSQLGFTVRGVDNDRDALATHQAMGHASVFADLRSPFLRYDPFTYDLVWASPPCTAFSMAGKGDGRYASKELIDAIDREDWTWGAREGLDPTIWLVLPTMRAILHYFPKWVCFENVAQAGTVMDACLKVLGRYGYRGDTGKLYAEQFGVAQTRTRYFLVASRVGEAPKMPSPTHARYSHPKNVKRNRAIRDHAIAHNLKWWVSMGEALGWTGSSRMVSNYGTGGDASNRGERTGEEPAPTITSKIDRNKVYRDVVALDRRCQQKGSSGRSGREMVPMVPIESPSPSLTSVGLSGPFVWRRAEDIDPERQLPAMREAPEQETLRLTPAEAGRLQAFPDDMPWQGSRTSVFRQIGNAVPPPLTMAVAGAAMGTVWQVILDVYLRELYSNPLPTR